MRDRIAAILMVVLAISGGVYAMLEGGGNGGPAPTPATQEPDGIANFSRRPVPTPLRMFLVRAPDGSEKTLADFRGKVLLVNLWASWCAPCLAEMPSLDRLEKLMGGPRFQVISINVDRKEELARAWFAKQKIQHLGFYRDATLQSFAALGASDLPLTVLIDGQGRELGRLAGGAQWDGREARKLIEGALDAEAKKPSPADLAAPPETHSPSKENSTP